MTKKELFEKLKSKLPLKRDKSKDFQEFVEETFNWYKQQIENSGLFDDSEEYEKVEGFIDRTNKSLKFYLEGDIFGATKEFEKGIKLLINDNILPIFMNNNNDIYYFENGSYSLMYRLTEFDDSIWCIPFSKRHLASTNRFSFAGLPCLYIGNSIETCYAEIGGDKDISSYFIAGFGYYYEKIKTLDLTFPNLKYAERDEYYYDKSILSWPLVAICMIKKPIYESHTKFVIEYIFPQLVISFLAKQSNESEIWAVKYYSTKFSITDNKYNIAIPIKNEAFLEGLKNKIHETVGDKGEKGYAEIKKNNVSYNSKFEDLENKIQNELRHYQNGGL
jgi:hypothetical protein